MEFVYQNNSDKEKKNKTSQNGSREQVSFVKHFHTKPVAVYNLFCYYEQIKTKCLNFSNLIVVSDAQSVVNIV